MNKFLTKVTALCVGLAMVAGVGVAVGSKVSEARAADVAIDLTAQGFSNQQDVTTVTSGSITLTFAKADGTNPPKYYTSGTSVRTYAKNTLTIATSGEENITQIVFTLGGTTTATPTANTGTYNGGSKTWTGSAKSIVLTNAASGQYHYKTVTVTTSGGGGEEDPVLQSISISGEKTEYNVGDEFVKPTVTATYDKGNDQDVTESATCTGYNMGVAGDYTVTVSYGGKTTTYDITVTDSAVGELLYSCDFTSVGTHGYTQNKEFTLNGKDWVASISQVNGGVFYLGCNNTNTAKGILNDNASFADVVTALAAEDTPYSSAVSTAHAYAMRFANAYDNVGSVEFVWAGGNNAFQVYLFGDQGSGLVKLASTNYATSGSAVSGSVEWNASGYGESFNEFVIVARPGATGSTATAKTLRAATFKIYEGEAEPIDPTMDTLVILLNDTTPSPATVSYSGGGLYYANDKDGNDINAEWSSSNEAIFTVAKNGNNVCYVTPVAPGTATITAHADGYNDGTFVLTINAGDVDSVIVTGSMSKTTYTTAESWSNDGLIVTVHYQYGYETVVANNSVSWSYSPENPAVIVKSVVATATYGEQSGSSSAQTVEVTRVNPIQALYSKAKGASTGEFYGYYVGFATGSGPIVMDGEYGMMLYNSSQDVSAWTEGETILHVTAGTIDIYNGLYEVKSYTVETVESAEIDTPIVHTATGSESATDANRLTNATGHVAAAPTRGSFTGAPAASDIQFTYTVGSNTFTVFYKKAAQTSDVMAALNDSLTNGTELTLKGFTSWYNNFQVTMIGLVEEDEGYTAEDFCQDLLDQTDDVCTGFVDGDNNHDALVLIWSNLASSNKYPSLPSDQKEILAEADRNEDGSVVEQAMARYDFLTGKYDLSNFINGRSPIVTAGSYVAVYDNNIDASSSVTVIVIVAVTSMTLLGVTLVLRKRKHQ